MPEQPPPTAVAVPSQAEAERRPDPLAAAVAEAVAKLRRGALRARGRQTPRDVADAASPHGGSALPAVAPVTLAGRGGLWVPPHRRVPTTGAVGGRCPPAPEASSRRGAAEATRR